jgi:RNA polymerase sigma-70 factor, ECF subfamily
MGGAGAAAIEATGATAVRGSSAATRSRSEELPDEALVARVLGGNRAAFEPLVRRHQASLFRYARGMGLDPDTAADVVQDAMVKAFESLETCREPERVGVWMGRILRNRCLDFLKSAARRGTPLHPSLPATRGNPEREAERSGLRSRLNRALATLPAEQREAFLMKHAEGRSYEEMAELSECSVSAMKMRVHRAREALQTELGPPEPAG